MVTGTLTAQPNGNGVVTSIEEGEIKNVIRSYFDVRYLALSSLQLDDFSNLVSNTSEARTFLDSEMNKLAVEIKHAELNHLRYVDYKYFLDFKNITVDISSQTARVSVIEGHDVIFESSKEINPTKPVISSMRNRDHSIAMRKDNGQWRIVSDDYDDYLWRILKQTKIPMDEMLLTMREPQNPVWQSTTLQVNSLCSLAEDDSTHIYDRDGSVAYAHEYAFNYNLNTYDDFSNSELGGDCANFVSQAIYEGGNASMAYPSEQGVGTIGWYYTDINHRASAWTQVTKLHEFITQPLVWDEGPEGCEVSQNEAEPGDIIQYDWDNDGEWDHAIIIVMSEDNAQGTRLHWVATHSEDNDYYPFTDYIYSYLRTDSRSGCTF